MSTSLLADEAINENLLGKLFSKNKVHGSILIESKDGSTKFQYNVDEREAFVPASTFKIPNTLIILEEGLIKDISEVIKWDGVERAFPSWNQDQTLKTAFQFSCVWCYQQYAKMIGDDTYHSYLRKFNYGNLKTGKELTRFWLDGDLRVSVQNQIQFLRKVYSEELPVNKKHFQTLKSIMLTDNQQQYKVFSKTGWSGKNGWYVGYLTTGNNVWFFANHIEVNSKSDLVLRKQITMDAFKALRIIN